tara:strand:- start:52 stop:624 length:573 start_codon:yes stop_codon:yes gene_type:complete
MKKSFLLFALPTAIAMLFSSCQSGKTIRVDSSQVTEYRDLTVRDLDEFSSKMFVKLMQSPLAKTATGEPPRIAIGPMTAQVAVEFPEALRINGLKNVITQSGLARIAGTSSNASLNDFIRFANAQQGRATGNQPDYVLTQKIYENREYQNKVIFKTYTYILELVDLRSGSTSIGDVVVSETENIIKQVRK